MKTFGEVMTDRTPIRNAEELAGLDDAEILDGYLSGRDGEPEPGGNRSFSFWHGWRTGRVDGGHDEKDAAMGELARDVIKTGYLKNHH